MHSFLCSPQMFSANCFLPGASIKPVLLLMPIENSNLHPVDARTKEEEEGEPCRCNSSCLSEQLHFTVNNLLIQTYYKNKYLHNSTKKNILFLNFLIIYKSTTKTAPTIKTHICGYFIFCKEKCGC